MACIFYFDICLNFYFLVEKVYKDTPMECIFVFYICAKISGHFEKQIEKLEWLCGQAIAAGVLYEDLQDNAIICNKFSLAK